MTEPMPYVERTFRITTYFKRKRNEAGITQLASKRIPIGTALQWVLDELPDEAWDANVDNDVATIVIDWTKVPRS